MQRQGFCVRWQCAALTVPAYSPYDIRQVTLPLQSSVSLSAQWDQVRVSFLGWLIGSDENGHQMPGVVNAYGMFLTIFSPLLRFVRGVINRTPLHTHV